jgi:hypothetical protein
MKLVTILALAGAAAVLPPSRYPEQNPTAPQKFPLSTVLLRGHEGIQRNLVEAAELMPEEHYAFRATPETKPFGQIVAHIAFSRFGACAALRGTENPRLGQKEDAPRTKAEAVALLKEAGTYCTEAFTPLTDEALTQLVAVGANRNEVAKGAFVAGENAHANEVYGTMAVYLRLKGLVPPSTARAQQPRKTQ